MPHQSLSATDGNGHGGNGHPPSARAPSGPLVTRLLSLGQSSIELATVRAEQRGGEEEARRESAGRQTAEAEAGGCLLVKGAPEELLKRCVGGGLRDMGLGWKGGALLPPLAPST